MKLKTMAKLNCGFTFEMASALDQFLASVQAKAYTQVLYATKNREDALDIIQDSMMKLAERYASKPEMDWPKLFQRILQNRLRDWSRRKKVRRVIVWWEQHQDYLEEPAELFASTRDTPEELLATENMFERIQWQLSRLPIKQQQAFLLRVLWGYSVEEAADAMGCGTNTVKTHYQRAMQALRQNLEARKC